MSESLNFPTVMPSLLLDFANAKQLDPRVTFTRASTATYYDEDTVALSEQNLLLQSQTFDNAAWTKVSATVAANTAVAPDGTTTSDSFTPTAVSNLHAIYQFASVASGSLVTASVYAKANGYNFLSIALNNGSIASGNESIQNFNLLTGTVASSFNTPPTNASITDVGGGWYRCVITFAISTTLASAAFFVVNTDANPRVFWTGDGTSGIYLWGAQLEQRSAATAYTATTTQPITNYIPVLMTAAVGVPRFIFNPTTRESLGLLIEEQRANLALRSENFTISPWSNEATTEESNVIIAPDGTLTGDKLIESAINENHRIFQSITKAASATTYSCTVFVKGGANRNVRLSFDSGFATNNVQAGFDLTTGTVSVAATSGGTFSAASASIQSVGNGWYRCAVIGTTGTETTVRLNVWLLNGTTSTYTGDGFSGVYVWGAQLEAGAFPTSYIPTVASSVTRSVDTASMTGVNFSQWYRADEGTLYGECTASLAANKVIFSIDLDNNNNTNIRYTGSSTSVARGEYTANGFPQASLTANISANERKIVMAYKANDFALVANASAASTDASGITFQGTAAYIGYTPVFGTALNGTIKKIAYYPWRLTNAQLQALTS